MKAQLINLIYHHIIFKGWRLSLNVINFNAYRGGKLKALLNAQTTMALSKELYNIMQAKYE
jgi:hypothetical protein